MNYCYANGLPYLLLAAAMLTTKLTQKDGNDSKCYTGI
jgi:hypothetical protein